VRAAPSLIGPASETLHRSGRQPSDNPAQIVENDPKRTRQMIRLADGVVFDYVVPIFNMVTSTAKDSNGA
jgi:hypothetical protein